MYAREAVKKGEYESLVFNLLDKLCCPEQTFFAICKLYSVQYLSYILERELKFTSPVLTELYPGNPGCSCKLRHLLIIMALILDFASGTLHGHIRRAD